MITEQLLTYIRDNRKSGFGDGDIEVALRAAGWDAADIAAAFSAIAGGTNVPIAIVPTPAAAVPNNAQADVDAELARIQAELKASGRRPLAAPSRETGIIGFMLRHKIVSTTQQANIVLVAITVVFFAIAIWRLF